MDLKIEMSIEEKKVLDELCKFRGVSYNDYIKEIGDTINLKILMDQAEMNGLDIDDIVDDDYSENKKNNYIIN